MVKVFKAMFIASFFSVALWASPTIGVVDVDVVFKNAKTFQEKNAQIQSKVQAVEKELRADAEKISLMAQALEKDGPVMKSEEVSSKRKEIESLSMQLASKEREAKIQFQQEQRMMVELVTTKVRNASDIVAKEKGLNMVMYKGSLIGLYDQSLEITEDVKNLIDKA